MGTITKIWAQGRADRLGGRAQPGVADPAMLVHNASVVAFLLLMVPLTYLQLDRCEDARSLDRWLRPYGELVGKRLAARGPGYSPEPWHLRHVSTEAAADVVRSGGVLETARGFAPAPDYR